MENNKDQNSRMKTENTKTINDVCQGCLANNNLHDMFKNHFNKKLTDTEVYAEMLFSCFSIQIGSNSTDEKKNYFMCTECILKLKDAFRFKLQIAYTQAVLQQMSEFHVSREEKKDDYNSECDNIEVDCDFGSENTTAYEINVKPKNNSKVKRRPNTKKQIKTDNVVRSTDHLSINSKLKRAKKRQPVHLPYIPEKSELQCRICNETFFFNKALKHHLNVHSQNFICDKCGKTFSKKSSLKDHVLTEHESKIYACSLCPKIYKNYGSLNAHKRRSHIVEKLHRCPICFEKFDEHRHRIKHLQNEHGMIKNLYKCKHCLKGFNCSGNLSRHIRNIHLKERKCICQECGLRFYNNSSLIDHMTVHTGEKTFECKVCHKCYARKKTLTEHMKIHNNEKQFICAICNRAFTQKCTLKGHMKVHFK